MTPEGSEGSPIFGPRSQRFSHRCVYHLGLVLQGRQVLERPVRPIFLITTPFWRRRSAWRCAWLPCRSMKGHGQTHRPGVMTRDRLALHRSTGHFRTGCAGTECPIRAAAEPTRTNSRVAPCVRFLPRCFRGSVQAGDVPRPPKPRSRERDIDPRLPLRCAATRSACSAS